MERVNFAAVYTLPGRGRNSIFIRWPDPPTCWRSRRGRGMLPTVRCLWQESRLPDVAGGAGVGNRPRRPIYILPSCCGPGFRRIRLLCWPWWWHTAWRLPSTGSREWRRGSNGPMMCCWRTEKSAAFWRKWAWSGSISTMWCAA